MGNGGTPGGLGPRGGTSHYKGGAQQDASAGYIDEVVRVQGALDTAVWPALRVSPTLALALSTWTHFR